MNSQEIMKTENVLVRIMALAKDGATEWHFHTEVRDFFVCLQGAIRVEVRDPGEQLLLLPGQRAEVVPRRLHRVMNVASDRSEYLLIQGVGVYDFCVEGAKK